MWSIASAFQGAEWDKEAWPTDGVGEWMKMEENQDREYGQSSHGYTPDFGYSVVPHRRRHTGQNLSRCI